MEFTKFGIHCLSSIDNTDGIHCLAPNYNTDGIDCLASTSHLLTIPMGFTKCLFIKFTHHKAIISCNPSNIFAETVDKSKLQNRYIDSFF